MTEAPKDENGRLQIDKPRWNQDTFSGRVKHFFAVTDPRTLLVTNSTLDAAKDLVIQYRSGLEPPGTTDEQVWYAKKLFSSAFHPDTGDKQILIGRMSAQVPMNMTITGAMVTFYKTTPTVIFWQWINQSFNALVNYTNRSGDAPIEKSTLLQAYASATGAALTISLGLNSLVKSLPPIVGRYVPFAAVAAANCVNIPLMRQRELVYGVPVFDQNGKKLGESKVAAKKAVAMTVVSRILMAAPGMTIPPIVMNYLEKKTFMKRMPWLASPLTICMVGLCLTFTTPVCCAIFPQTSSLKVMELEEDLKEIISKKGHIDRVYFNKGL